MSQTCGCCADDGLQTPEPTTNRAGLPALAYRVGNHGTFFAVTGFITLPLLFMSNAFVPLDAMPRWMEIIARLNPLTYAITAMRTLVLDGWEASLGTPFAVLTVVALAFLAIGTMEFRRLTGQRVR